MILRSASNLRIVQTVSALSLAGIRTALHRILCLPHVRAAWEMFRAIARTPDPNVFIDLLARQGTLPPASVEFLRLHPGAQLSQAIAEVEGAMVQLTADQIRPIELTRLKEAAEKGAPPEPAPGPSGSGPFIFRVDRSKILSFEMPGHPGLRLRVTPVDRLRVVVAQVSFMRQIRVGQNSVPTPVDCGSEGEVYGERIYPALELNGEGVFLDLEPGCAPLPLDGPRARAWAGYHTVGALPLLPRQPEEIWWHTLSHRLVRALALDSGYGAASIRERTYPTGPGGSGLLLYTSQPGGDGTLGGLVGLVPSFGRLLQRAMDGIEDCSNDPLCGERNDPTHGHGACCHACLLNSETSCEHMNLALDRLLLLETSAALAGTVAG